eukprot:3385780-Alexandrium_andersonii.AAC.1
MSASLVGSEMCIRDRYVASGHDLHRRTRNADLHTRAAGEGNPTAPARAVMFRSRPRHEQGLAASGRAGETTKRRAV